jgi:hypothetical protein
MSLIGKSANPCCRHHGIGATGGQYVCDTCVCASLHGCYSPSGLHHFRIGIVRHTGRLTSYGAPEARSDLVYPDFCGVAVLADVLKMVFPETESPLESAANAAAEDVIS